MLRSFFARTQSRDDILAILGASLKKRDETTARDKLLELLQSHVQDPEIVQPVNIALAHMASWDDPYQLLVTTGKMTEHVTDSRALATLADHYAINAARQLESSDPLYALSTYGQVFEHSPGETDHQLSCLEGILRITESPHPADIEPMARHLVTLAEAADNHDPAQLRLHNRVMDMAEQVRDPVLAMELYLAIYGNSDDGSGLERDSFQALMALSQNPAEKDGAAIIEGLYHAHEIGANNPIQRAEIENRLIVLADASCERDPLTAYAAYHFLLEELPAQDRREQGLMTKMMHLSESLATRDQESVMSGLALLQKRAGQNSSIFSRARHLHESMTARLSPATYPDLKPLSPKNFSIIHGSGITPL
ncbi:MAG: hypothetical protein HYS17_10520 [Micavibrio aeruginosavorus]|uniref:Uncharacterized protein n=1 Tax=Micavibrio aeruginosavorus TaxID=349221 RepID=A0A7T5UH12_9BACT|nr:MAG: hypothetical protein HYS17_10520 [Micavibrio aeruginosavorus]